MRHTTTPWYVTLIDEYNEIHIQSAPEDIDNHVLSISYRHSSTCPAHAGHHRRDPYEPAQCDPTECVGLREAMANAKLIVESVNEKTFGGQLLVNQTLFDEVGV